MLNVLINMTKFIPRQDLNPPSPLRHFTIHMRCVNASKGLIDYIRLQLLNSKTIEDLVIVGFCSNATLNASLFVCLLVLIHIFFVTDK